MTTPARRQQKQLQPTPAGADAPVVPLIARFEFDGGAATYVGTAILAFLITLAP